MNSPRYAPAGLLIEQSQVRVAIDGGPGADPAGPAGPAGPPHPQGTEDPAPESSRETSGCIMHLFGSMRGVVLLSWCGPVRWASTRHLVQPAAARWGR